MKTHVLSMASWMNILVAPQAPTTETLGPKHMKIPLEALCRSLLSFAHSGHAALVYVYFIKSVFSLFQWNSCD